MSEIQQSKKISVGLLLGWIFGILFIITGISSIFSEPIQGIVMLIMAAVILPPINKLVDEKWHFHLSGGIKLVVIIIGFSIFGAMIDTSNTTTQQDNQLPMQSISESEGVVEEQEAEDKANNMPAEYKSALNKAASYSNIMHMSKRGVYDQLVSEYGEKFSAAAAQYAIDNVKADWNANALAKAKSYQDTMNMSPAGIHDQLTSAYGEKFTQSEADYAIQHLND